MSKETIDEFLESFEPNKKKCLPTCLRDKGVLPQDKDEDKGATTDEPIQARIVTPIEKTIHATNYYSYDVRGDMYVGTVPPTTKKNMEQSFFEKALTVSLKVCLRLCDIAEKKVYDSIYEVLEHAVPLLMNHHF